MEIYELTMQEYGRSTLYISSSYVSYSKMMSEMYYACLLYKDMPDLE